MANSKISALTSASTPLAGTEVLPIVQSSATVKVAVSDLTAGRTVSASVINIGTTTSVTNRALHTYGAPAKGARFETTTTTSQIEFTDSGTATQPSLGSSGDDLIFQVGFATKATLQNSTKDFLLASGNFIPSTAAKGVNFTANTPAAGMTSQLLNWYEEGTWTPAQGGGLTVVGAFSSTGKYTRIGRQVSISGTVTGATSVAVTAAGVITSNLPFTVVTAGHGNATNAAVTASAAVICTSTNITSAAAIAATVTITFSATYFV